MTATEPTRETLTAFIVLRPPYAWRSHAKQQAAVEKAVFHELHHRKIVSLSWAPCHRRAMAKSFHPGRSAQNGYAAALLAQSGFTAGEHGIEAPRGFAAVQSTEYDLSKVTSGLGTDFDLRANTYKPYPCGIVIHPSIDACIQLKEEHNLRGEEIRSLDLRVHPLVLELTGKKAPRTGLEGKFSVYHSAAVALVRGRAGIAEYSDEVVNDPRVIAVRDRVTATADDSVHEAKAIARARLEDGRTVEKVVEFAVGSLERPLSDEAIERKVHDLSDPILGEQAIDRMIRVCRGILDLADASELARTATPQ